MRSGQGSIEYIIILGVIVLVALVVVTSIGGFGIFDFSAKSEVRVNEIIDQLGAVGFTQTIDNNGYVQASLNTYTIRQASSAVLVIRSRTGEECNLSAGTINSEWVTVSSMCLFLNGTVSDSYNFNCSVQYVDDKNLTHKAYASCQGFYEEGENLTGVLGYSSIILSNETAFGEGEYENTEWGTVILSQDNQSGVYTSKVFETRFKATWLNFSWAEDLPYGEPLPGDESSDYGANMIDNVLLMHFEESTGSSQVNDSSGRVNHGSLSGPTLESEGKFSNGISFDGNDDYITVTDDDSFDFDTGAFSIEAWIKTSVVTGELSDRDDILTKGDPSSTGFGLAINYGRAALFTGSNYPPLMSSVEVNDSTWHHIVGTRTSCGVTSIYVDGVLSNQGSNSESVTTTTDLVIGKHPLLNESYYTGLLDEIAVYARELSAEEILNHYKRGILRLNATVRSCDDALCSGESWGSELENATINELSVTNNEFFQFKFNFFTENTTWSPVLNNVTIGLRIP